jgi:hypothetical protein
MIIILNRLIAYKLFPKGDAKTCAKTLLYIKSLPVSKEGVEYFIAESASLY